MPRSVRLRAWQKAALERFDAWPGPDFLAVATPGAGKTTFALAAALRCLAGDGGPRRLIVVAPTAHLKRQWAAAAAAFGVHLEPAWSAGEGLLPADMHGLITTYQQVAANPGALGRLAPGSMVIFDEIHHAGDDRAWGSSVREAFGAATVRLALSGTPFRSDTRAIPFVRYELDMACPDYEYGYGEALADGRVVRPVYFPRTNGHMEWSAPDGATHSASFDDPLDAVGANQRLRTALSLEGDWLPTVLACAHERLGEIRRREPDAAGLVIATDVDHARGIADALQWRLGVRAVVATSDDDGASERIAAFATSERPWLVAVRMVSEGVDIPRLRVGVYATTTTTELFFRQAVGRLVRWRGGASSQPSYFFIPDDPRLRARAFQIAELRRHSLRREDSLRRDRARSEDPAALDAPGGSAEAGDDQLSLFAVISAVATGTAGHEPPAPAGTSTTSVPGGWEEPDEETGYVHDDGLTLDLPVLAGSAPSEGPDPAARVVTRGEHKAALRDANAEVARALATRTGWTHARVNAELNRLAGLRRVSEATLDQLARRLRQAEAWYSRL